MVHKGEEEVEFSVSLSYIVWRNNELSKVFSSFEVQSPITVYKVGSFITEEPKRKRISNEKELQDELDKFRIELSCSKS
jgi:hypothetical protein